jgi:S1-C subfamily serine protease
MASGYSPGDKVVVEVNRDGQILEVEVTLGTLK